MKPYVYVTDKDLPAIKDWKVGETYEVIMRVKMTSANQSERSGLSASLEVADIMVPDEERDINDMTNAEFEEYSGRIKRKNYES